jgi:hypothetical protein
MRSNWPSEVVSDGACKANDSASKARVGRKKSDGSAVIDWLESLYRALAGRPAPKAMIQEEVADAFG